MFDEKFDGFYDGEIDFYLGQVKFLGSIGHYPNINFAYICDQDAMSTEFTTLTTTTKTVTTTTTVTHTLTG